MDILLLLIPMSLVLVALIGAAFAWSVKSGQYDDLEGPAHRILADDDGAAAPGGDAAGGGANLTPINPAQGAARNIEGSGSGQVAELCGRSASSTTTR